MWFHIFQYLFHLFHLVHGAVIKNETNRTRSEQQFTQDISMFLKPDVNFIPILILNPY